MYDKIRLTVINPRVLKIVSISSDVFERRARTGSGTIPLFKSKDPLNSSPIDELGN